MAKDPAFLFYPGDWLGGTMGMTFEQKGAYFELLLFQFNNGRFTEAQAKQVLSICDASVWHMVKQKFSTDGAKFWSSRLESEIDKRKKFSESRRNNAKGSKTEQKPIQKVKAYAKHMENENRNENESINNTKKSKLEIFEMLFTDDIYIEGLSMAHKGKDIKQAFEECYIHHSNAPNPPREMWEWKQKFNTWLSIKSHNGNSKDKRKSNSDALKANVAADIYKASREQ